MSRPNLLTPRQAEVMLKIAQGYRYREIAEESGITEDAIPNLMQRVRKRLGARTNEQAVAICLRKGII